MKISTKGIYAVEAVFDLAIHTSNSHETLKNVANRRNISENYLEQIFMDLRKNGIVKSIRGPQGGYLLAKEASAITCGEIIRAVEGYLSPLACITKDHKKIECERNDNCSTKSFWITLRDEINMISDSITLKDLLDAYNVSINNQEIEFNI